MPSFAIALLAQLAVAAGASPRPTAPVLAFPEPGLDDGAAYQGYQTRIFRDAAGNTVQVYLDGREGRVVHLLADAENASVALSARTADGRPAPLRWNGPDATVAQRGRTRTLAYALVADAPEIRLGQFLLGSMRVERDFQYEKRHQGALDAAPYAVPEAERLVAALARLAPAERPRHLALLGAGDLAALRARLRPAVTAFAGKAIWVARVRQPSLDGRDTLTLELTADPARVTLVRQGAALALRARTGGSVPFTLRVATTGEALTPLARAEIFTPAFLAFLDSARQAGEAPGADEAARLRARRMERQARGVELLVSREKLMAGLPTYATYFGRDMLMTALMMREVWRPEMMEFALAAALRKLSPTSGEVSHEEALGGQATREAAAEYVPLVDSALAAGARGDRGAADALLARARGVLADQRRARENYHMVDDEFQLPVLAARWLTDARVSDERRHAFLLDSSDGGGPRLARLLGELALVARLAAPYAADATAANLVGFARRTDVPGDTARWSSRSWRDSGAGYANGRYAMDVNALWVPHALDAIAQILAAVRTVGMDADALARRLPSLASELTPEAPLGRWMRDPTALAAAARTWHAADRHFVVRLAPAEAQARITARLAALPEEERSYWTGRLAASGGVRDSLAFLDLALDAAGRPIGVANTDPATRLFLGEGAGAAVASATAPNDSAVRAGVLRDVRLFTTPYPAGLLVEGVGPVVANDAYAPPAVWPEFARDPYHGPRVVWGREVNLFLLGVANRIRAAGDAPGDPTRAAYVRELRAAAERVAAEVEASGFHSELWSYTFVGGRPVASRYGSAGDVQLWSTTDLAVAYALAQLGR
jgi:hypothetical protein